MCVNHAKSKKLNKILKLSNKKGQDVEQWRRASLPS